MEVFNGFGFSVITLCIFIGIPFELKRNESPQVLISLWPNDIVSREGVLFLLVKIYGMKEVSQA